MAQSAEHILGKDEVAGSIPAISSMEKPLLLQGFLIFLLLQSAFKKGERTLSLSFFFYGSKPSKKLTDTPKASAKYFSS